MSVANALGIVVLFNDLDREIWLKMTFPQYIYPKFDRLLVGHCRQD